MDINGKNIIVGIGELLWDLLPEGKQLGGAPTNFVFHAQALGGKGFPVSAIGLDDLGLEIQDRLKNAGLDQSYLTIDNEHPTGTVTVKLDAQGVPDFTIHENVAWDFIPFSEKMKELAGKTKAVCFGSLAQRNEKSMNTIISFLDLMSDDTIKVFDVNLRQTFYTKDIILPSLKRANVVKLNDDELPILARLCDISGSEREMLDYFIEKYQLHLIALTKGSKGSILLGKDGFFSLKAPSVEVADTVGAGDAFTAAVVMGLIKGLSLDIVQKNATMLSAYVCTQHGAMPELSESLKKELML